MERRIEVVFSAVDDYSTIQRKFDDALRQTGGALASAGNESGKFARKLADLTSASEWGVDGLKKFKNILEGIAFGGVIGLSAALTNSLIEMYHETFATQQQIDKLNNSVMNQAKAWKLLPEPMGAVTAAQVDLYNAELRYLQLQERSKGTGLERTVRTLEQVRRTMEENPEWAGAFGNSIEQIDLRLAQARKNLAEYNQLMGLMPATVGKVQAALSSGKGGDSSLKLPEGGSLMAFVLGDLTSPETAERLNLAGIEFGRNLTAAMKAGVVTAAQSEDLNFSMAAFQTIDANDNAVYFAMLDERFQKETEYEEMLLDSNLAYSNQRIAMEQNLQNTIMGLKFGAANQSIALLAIVGQKSKALQLAALVAQKALAMAQVWIQTQTASSAALAPPPLGLGPIYGAPLAASIQFWGKAQMGLIAATGLAEAAIGGGAGGPSGIGGGGGVGSLPITAPSSNEARGAQNITVIVHALDPSSVNWDRMMEDNIKPAMERLSGDRNVELNIKVAQR